MASLPHFILINPTPRLGASPAVPRSLCSAWNDAIQEMLPGNLKSHFTVIEGYLTKIPAHQLQCDCVVSPANSFGIMDGGYDMALSDAFKGKEGHWTLTRCCQAALQKRWHGYAPASSATITALPAEVSGAPNNPWAATSIAIVPTMRKPESMAWHKDVVYNAMWALCVEIARWNASGEGTRIEHVLMTGLATGWGEISSDKCARQMILAVRHFAEGVPAEADWASIETRLAEIDATLDL